MRLFRRMRIIALCLSLVSALGAERPAGGSNKTSYRFTLELKEIKFGNQAAEKTGREGQLAEKIAKALAVSSGKSKVFRFIAKPDRTGKLPSTHSLSLHFQLFGDNWVLSYQVILNETMKVVKQDLIEFENPADPYGIAAMLVPVIESALKPWT